MAPPAEERAHDSGAPMKLQQVSMSCYAVLNERHRLCDANSGLVNRGGGVVVDTQADLAHARRMVELFGSVWHGMPKYVINTSEAGDHVAGNQLFAGAQIIAHRMVPDRMRRIAEPSKYARLVDDASSPLARRVLGLTRPGARAIGDQLRQDYDFEGIDPTPPTMLFDQRFVLDVGGTEVQVLYVGPCQDVGDAIVHVPGERVLFAGNAVYRRCTPLGWSGRYERWQQALDLVIWLDPDVIVPGHGPVCGVEGAMELKAYLGYVYDESRRCFALGLSALEASKRIGLGPYGEWRCPARLFANVESAYRDIRYETADAGRISGGSIEAMYEVARARRLAMEF